MPEISVIIPSYNKETYMGQCLDSVLSQTFQDFEIILYDDASSDRSPELCRSYASKDARIKYFQHETNLGQQTTIKDGVAHACGEWVAFVDADDTLPLDALSSLHELCRDETDIIVGFSWQGDNSVTHIPIEEWRIKMLQSDPILCTRWAKLYRRLLLDDYTMCGSSAIKLGEDMIQNIKVAFRAQHPVTVVYKKVYDYNRNEGSYSVGYSWTVDKTQILYNTLRDTLPDNPKPAYRQAIVANGLGMLEKILLKGSPQERSRLKDSGFLKQLREDAAQCDTPVKKHEQSMLNSPTSPLTRLILLTRRGSQILAQFVKRHLLHK